MGVKADLTCPSCGRLGTVVRREMVDCRWPVRLGELGLTYGPREPIISDKPLDYVRTECMACGEDLGDERAVLEAQRNAPAATARSSSPADAPSSETAGASVRCARCGAHDRVYVAGAADVTFAMRLLDGAIAYEEVGEERFFEADEETLVCENCEQILGPDDIWPARPAGS